MRSLTLRKSSSFLAWDTSRMVVRMPEGRCARRSPVRSLRVVPISHPPRTAYIRGVWSLTWLDRLKRDLVAVRPHPNTPGDGFGAGQLHRRLLDLIGPEAVGEDDAFTAQRDPEPDARSGEHPPRKS